MNKNVVMCPEGTTNQNNCAGKDQQQFPRPTDMNDCICLKHSRKHSALGTEIAPPKREDVTKCSKIVEGAS